MSPPTIYLNGSYLASGPLIPLDDPGFTHGIIITDRLRTFRQLIFRLDDHLRRFRQSCELAFVPQPRPDAEIADAARQLIKVNAQALGRTSEFSIAIFATPGVGEPTLGIQVMPLNFKRDWHLFERGAILEPMPRALTPDILDPRIKHRSRLPYWIARNQQLQRSGADPHVEPVFTTPAPEEFVRETPVANFLTVIAGEVISPPRAFVLNGITLQVVEELCGGLGIPFREREIPLREAANSEECLLSNTTYCLASVSRIGGKAKLFDGPIFRRLLSAFNELVGLDIRRQFLD
jgi:branched-subunit amino acid aminotransferase/4-amino-4-deoxychorismate lyase